MFVWLSNSVHLARRVLQLERQNTSLRRELERHKSQTGQISEEVNTRKHPNIHNIRVCVCVGSTVNGFKFNLWSKKKSIASQHLFYALVFPPPQPSHINSDKGYFTASMKIIMIYFSWLLRLSANIAANFGLIFLFTFFTSLTDIL